MLIAIVIVSFIAAGIVDLKLRKKFSIEKNEKFMDQYVGKWHFLLEVVLIIMFLSYMSVDYFDQTTIYSLLFAFLMLLFALRGFFEYLFRKDKRRHILSFTYTGLCAIVTLAILLFM